MIKYSAEVRKERKKGEKISRVLLKASRIILSSACCLAYSHMYLQWTLFFSSWVKKLFVILSSALVHDENRKKQQVNGRLHGRKYSWLFF